MPDIDPRKIKPGDTVKVRYQDEEMVKKGIAPYEYTTIVHYIYGYNYVGAAPIGGSAITVLEHTPARPDWADALVVRDKDGDLWHRNARKLYEGLSKFIGGAYTAREIEDEYGPITVVIDADGNPPEREHEWLDADALDKLPEESLILPKNRRAPFERGAQGWGPIGSRQYRHQAHEIAPARVLWTLEAGQ